MHMHKDTQTLLRIQFHPEDYLIFTLWLLLCFAAVAFNGTADEGDSVEHYLFARYAFVHPENFVNHWAKPLFVWIAAPIAQFGFAAVKLLNVTFWALQLAFVVRIARYFGTGYYWIIPVFGICAPMNLTHTLSSLTEPMFAVWLAGSIALIWYDRKWAGYILLSFLPLVRSEGLIVFCPVVVYMLLARDVRYLPLLAVGHLVVGLAGYGYHHDLLWTVHQNPYATLSIVYGRGSWDTFIKGMPNVIGWGVTFFLVVGCLDGMRRLLFKNQWFKDPIARKETILIYGVMLSYLAAHSLFWYYGIFKSLGLLRVVLGIMPMILFVAWRGFTWSFQTLPTQVPNAVRYLILAGGLVFGLAMHRTLRYDFTLNAAQQSLRNAAKDLQQRLPDLSERIKYHASVDAALAFDLDYFDHNLSRTPDRLYSGELAPEGSLVIWDDKFMPNEGKTPLTRLEQDPRLQLLGAYRVYDPRFKKDRQTYIFEVRGQTDRLSEVLNTTTTYTPISSVRR